MKKSESRILCIEFFLLMVLIFNIFVLKTYNDWIIPIIFLISFAACYLLFGFEKDSKKDFKNGLLGILIFIFGYYIVTYVIGIFMGFLLSGYSLKFNNLITNIFPVLLFQVSKEILRYEINTKGERKKSILILSVIVFVFADIYSITYLYDIGKVTDLLEIFELYFVPFIAENILMTYTSINSGYRTNLVYQFLMKLPVYFLPIVPDLGEYIDVIIRLVFPCSLLFFLIKDSKRIKREGFVRSRQNEKLAKISFSATFVLLLLVVYLTSGVFSYYAITIGSESMYPKLDKGDITIVKKINNYSSLKVGDILVYEKEGRIVVHRITNIVNQFDRYVFTTKGDANNDEDGYPIFQEEVIGIVKFKIKYLGYPTIWLNEFVN